MHILYPEIRPEIEHTITTPDGQSLFVEVCGSSDGIPVVVLHEGPGLGCEPWHRQFFDPQEYRIILFDQRGCGRSSPFAEIQYQSIDHQLQDLETIRQALGIEKWLLFGCDWGALLALFYIEACSEHALGFIGVGMSLANDTECAWRYQKGANLFFPDYWEAFLRGLSTETDPLVALQQRLEGRDEIARMSAAKAWALWHGRLATRHSDISVIEWMADPHRAIAFATLCAHYYQPDTRPTNEQILKAAEALRRLACCTLIHGRFDMLSPLANVWRIIEQAPNVHLDIVRDAGHAAIETAMVDAIVRTTHTFARRLRSKP